MKPFFTEEDFSKVEVDVEYMHSERMSASPVNAALIANAKAAPLLEENEQLKAKLNEFSNSAIRKIGEQGRELGALRALLREALALLQDNDRNKPLRERIDAVLGE